MAKTKFGTIFVTPDDPAFLEEQVKPEAETLPLADINVASLRAAYVARQRNFCTAPFDPEGRHLRFFPAGFTVWSGFPGAGKCLGRGTPVMRFDGTVSPVEDIRAGDLLMGPDSKPKRVLALGRGQEMLYRVTPVKGAPYVCNESHVLSVKLSGRRHSEDPVNITVREYLAAPAWFRERAKGWRAAVDWPRKDVPIDPYFFGVWLGDGAKAAPVVYNPDEEVRLACESIAGEFGLRAVRFESSCAAIRMAGTKGRTNPIYDRLRDLGVTEAKRVPLVYRANSRAVRLQVLAGLLDTDGHLSNSGFDFISVDRQLSEDVAFIARSLGLAAYVTACRKGCQTGAVGDYWRVSISGDCSIIPTRVRRKQAPRRRQVKRVSVTGITVEPIGEGDYYGFELDGDGLFLLGDFTVTHNTTLLRQLACKFLAEGRSVFVCSLEEDPMDVFMRHVCTAMGTENPSENALQWCADLWSDRFKLWNYRPTSDDARHQKILAAIRVLAKPSGRIPPVEHVIIDSMMCLDVPAVDAEAQREFCKALTRTCQASGVHVHLVAHPRKPMSRDTEVDISDVAGSADVGRKADNVLFVKRAGNEQKAAIGECTDMLIAIKKQRYGTGAVRDIQGLFNRKLRQFVTSRFQDEPTLYLPREAYQDREHAEAIL